MCFVWDKSVLAVGKISLPKKDTILNVYQLRQVIDNQFFISVLAVGDKLRQGSRRIRNEEGHQPDKLEIGDKMIA